MQNFSHTNNLDTSCIVIKSSEMTRMHHNSLANFEKKKKNLFERSHVEYIFNNPDAFCVLFVPTVRKISFVGAGRTWKAFSRKAAGREGFFYIRRTS